MAECEKKPVVLNAASFTDHLNGLKPLERALIINVYNRLCIEYPEKSDVEMLEMTADWTGCLRVDRGMVREPPRDGERRPAVCFEVHPKGKPYKRGEKLLIMNVFNQLQHKHRGESETEITAMTATLLNCSTHAISRIRSEFRTYGGTLPPPNRRRPKPAPVGKAVKLNAFEEATLSAVRRKVHEFYLRNEMPTLDKVAAAVNADAELPSFEPGTIRFLLGDLGFHYVKRGRNSVVVERDDVLVWRRRYVRQLRQYRQEGRAVYYVDETAVGVGQATVKRRHDGSDVHPAAAAGGKGRLLVVHAGNEDGFVAGAELVFRSKKSGELGEDVDGPRFEQWFRNQLMPNIKPRSVIVVDGAPYHREKVERIPGISTRKAEIRAWLTDKGVSWLPDMINRELLSLVNEVKEQHTLYRVDLDAELKGHKVLRLPPYHCELNPMELAWAQVRDYVAGAGETVKMSEVEEMTKRALSRITPAKWREYVNCVIKEEQKMWEVDELDDIQVEQLAFNVINSSSEDSDENGGESGAEEP